MAILDTLSLAGSGVALDSRAARALAGITLSPALIVRLPSPRFISVLLARLPI